MLRNVETFQCQWGIGHRFKIISRGLLSEAIVVSQRFKSRLGYTLEYFRVHCFANQLLQFQGTTSLVSPLRLRRIAVPSIAIYFSRSVVD